MNQQRAPTRSDLLNFQTNFHAPVKRITGSTVHNVHSINSTLNGIRSNRSVQTPNLNSIIPAGSSIYSGSAIGPSARYGANLSSLRYIPTPNGSVVGSSRSGRGVGSRRSQIVPYGSNSSGSLGSIHPIINGAHPLYRSIPSSQASARSGVSLQSNATYHVVSRSSGGKRLSRTPSSVGSRVSRRGTTQVRPYQVLPGFLSRAIGGRNINNSFGSGRSSRTTSIGP